MILLNAYQITIIQITQTQKSATCRFFLFIASWVGISYRIISCHIISYHIIIYHIVSYHVIVYHVIYIFISYKKPYHFILYHHICGAMSIMAFCLYKYSIYIYTQQLAREDICRGLIKCGLCFISALPCYVYYYGGVEGPPHIFFSTSWYLIRVT